MYPPCLACARSVFYNDRTKVLPSFSLSISLFFPLYSHLPLFRFMILRSFPFNLFLVLPDCRYTSHVCNAAHAMRQRDTCYVLFQNSVVDAQIASSRFVAAFNSAASFLFALPPFLSRSSPSSLPHHEYNEKRRLSVMLLVTMSPGQLRDYRDKITAVSMHYAGFI